MKEKNRITALPQNFCDTQQKTQSKPLNGQNVFRKPNQHDLLNYRNVTINNSSAEVTHADGEKRGWARERLPP